MTNTRRVSKLYSLALDVVNDLEARSKATGEPMSRIVEQGLRNVLGTPAPDKDEDERFRGPTRSELAILSVLREAGPYWHLTFPLAQKAGLSSAVAEKALRALAREGKVYRWGEGVEFSDGTLGSAWGMTEPIATVREVIAQWEAKGDGDAVKLVQFIYKLAIAIEDVSAVRALIRPITGFTDDQLGILNKRETIALRNAEERRRVAELSR